MVDWTSVGRVQGSGQFSLFWQAQSAILVVLVLLGLLACLGANHLTFNAPETVSACAYVGIHIPVLSTDAGRLT